MPGPSCAAAACSCPCPHHLYAGPDLDSRAFSIFPVAFHDQPPEGLHEFQFFGHDDDQENDTWPLDHDPPTAADDRSPFEKHRPLFGPLQYHRGNGLTFEMSLGRHTDQPAASATIMSSCPGSTFTDAASSKPKEMILIEGQLQRPVDPAVEREAKVMRYREKRKRRCYKKQVRYACRKASAETRARVKGRFAKVPEGAAPRPQPTLAATYYDLCSLDLVHLSRS